MLILCFRFVGDPRLKEAGQLAVLQDAGQQVAPGDVYKRQEFKYLVKGNTYTIKAEAPGYQPKEITVVLDEAKNVDFITLEKA